MKTHTYDPSKSWEENYRALEAHHVEETTALVAKLDAARAQAKQLKLALEVQRELNAPVGGAKVVVLPWEPGEKPGHMSCPQPGSMGAHDDPCVRCGFRYTDD